MEITNKEHGMQHPILTEILRSVENVSDADISRARRTLSKREKHETSVRVIDDLHLIQIWTLGFIYSGQSDQYANMAVYESRDAEEARKFRADSSRYSKMANLCRDLFWLEASSGDTSLESLLSEGLGLREDFLIVIYKKDPTRGIEALLGGFSSGE